MEYKNNVDCSPGNAHTLNLQDMKSVKEVCEELAVTRKTLFYYDKIGLLIPSYRDGAQKHKYYSSKDIKKLYEIRKLRNVGMKVSEIKEYFESDTRKRKKILEEVQVRNDEEIKELIKQKNRIKQLIKDKEFQNGKEKK